MARATDDRSSPLTFDEEAKFQPDFGPGTLLPNPERVAARFIDLRAYFLHGAGGVTKVKETNEVINLLELAIRAIGEFDRLERSLGGLFSTDSIRRPWTTTALQAIEGARIQAVLLARAVDERNRLVEDPSSSSERCVPRDTELLHLMIAELNSIELLGTPAIASLDGYYAPRGCYTTGEELGKWLRNAYDWVAYTSDRLGRHPTGQFLTQLDQHLPESQAACQGDRVASRSKDERETIGGEAAASDQNMSGSTATISKRQTQAVEATSPIYVGLATPSSNRIVSISVDQWERCIRINGSYEARDANPPGVPRDIQPPDFVPYDELFVRDLGYITEVPVVVLPPGARFALSPPPSNDHPLKVLYDFYVEAIDTSIGRLQRSVFLRHHLFWSVLAFNTLTALFHIVDTLLFPRYGHDMDSLWGFTISLLAQVQIRFAYAPGPCPRANSWIHPLYEYGEFPGIWSHDPRGDTYYQTYYGSTLPPPPTVIDPNSGRGIWFEYKVWNTQRGASPSYEVFMRNVMDWLRDGTALYTLNTNLATYSEYFRINDPEDGRRHGTFEQLPTIRAPRHLHLPRCFTPRRVRAIMDNSTFDIVEFYRAIYSHVDPTAHNHHECADIFRRSQAELDARQEGGVEQIGWWDKDD